ncbi:unknown [Tropheryma whipplei str. Twist]|uniref:Uncharacterized protein n=1 Tax=Tropheryma whipplei (strain Twist) TaxID=203267 RepID=Q83FP6_TROWT|nr:unknown [Tropheryma whipplei str. Twist]
MHKPILDPTHLVFGKCFRTIFPDCKNHFPIYLNLRGVIYLYKMYIYKMYICNGAPEVCLQSAARITPDGVIY